MAHSDGEDDHPRAYRILDRPPLPSIRVFNARVHRSDSDLRMRLREALGEFNEYIAENQDLRLANEDNPIEPIDETERDIALTAHPRILLRLWRQTRYDLMLRDEEFQTIQELLQDKQRRIDNVMNTLTAMDGNQTRTDDINNQLRAEIAQLHNQLATWRFHYEQILNEIQYISNFNEDLVAQNIQMVHELQKQKMVIKKLHASSWLDNVVQELRDYIFFILGNFLFEEFPSSNI